MPKRKAVTVHSVRSNLVKMHSKSPSVMAFCPVCLGILPYSWQNTSRDITYEQLRKAPERPSKSPKEKLPDYAIRKLLFMGSYIFLKGVFYHYGL